MLAGFLEDFLDATSVHGFAYIHSRNHWTWRIFWFLTVLGGLGMAVHTIYFSLHAWSNNPVITTLDTIAAPIADVQFPTITACSDGQPDNWAFLENVLNNIAIECGTVEECKRTIQLRDDFKYDFEDVCGKFENYLYVDNFQDSHQLIVNYTFLASWLHSPDFIASMRTILQKTENQTFKVLDLYGLPSKYLAMGNYGIEEFKTYLNDSEYLSSVAKLGYVENFLPEYCPNFTEECKKVQAMWKLTYMMTNARLRFGSFIKNLVQFRGFASFGMKNKIGDISNKYHLDAYSDVCRTLPVREKNLHIYFKSLAKIVGFRDSEAVSLHDLPAMLSAYADIENWPPVMNQVFLYALCEEEGGNSGNDYDYVVVEGGISIGTFDLGASCITEWNDFLFHGSSIHPCENAEKNYTCCNRWSNKLGHNLEAIMKVMRLTYSGTSRFDLNSLIDEKSDMFLKYSLIEDLEPKVNPHTLLPWCNFVKLGVEKLNHFDPESCVLFEPVFTDTGLCHSFNPTPVSKLLHQSYFKDTFEKAFDQDIFKNRPIYNGSESGHALDFFLLGTNHNKNDMESDGMYEENEPSKFLLSISNKDNYINMKSMGLEVKAGYHAIWKVQVMETVPSDDIREIPPKLRNCKFEDETEGLEIFASYSQAACEFEVKVKEAQSICRCLPWYIPSSAKSRYDICDLYGNYCFNQIFINKTLDKTGCLPSCHQIQFSLDENVEKLDEDVMCQNWQSIASFINFAVSDETILLKLQKLVKYFSDDGLNSNYTYDYEVELVRQCKELVKYDLARVTVSFGNKQYVRAVISQRASFNDKLGAFGGTLGLFTGMSLLSIIELIYWALKLIKKLSDFIFGKMERLMN